MRRFCVMVMIGACIFLFGAAAVDEKKSPRCLHVKVIQETWLEGLRTRLEGNAWFKEPTLCRLEGKLVVADGQMEMKLTMVSTSEVLHQLGETALMQQVFRYDLRKLREVAPDFDPTQGFNPFRYREALARAAPGGKAPTQFVAGEEMEVHELKIESLLTSTAIGLPASVRVNRTKAWLSKKDHFPRKIEAYDDDKLVARTEFQELKLLDDVAQEKFEFKPPEGAIALDGTQLMIEMLKGAGIGKKE